MLIVWYKPKLTTDEGFIDDTITTAFSEDPRTIVDENEIAAEEEEVEDEMVCTFKAP